MVFEYLFTPLARILLPVAGTVAMTLGIYTMSVALIVTGGALYVLSVCIFFRMRWQLKERCRLMIEAIRNKDYSFRLPVQGMAGGERILQDTLNLFGEMIGDQIQQMEQREHFYKRILSDINSGIVILNEKDSVMQTNPAAAKLLGLPVLSTLNQLERYGKDVPQMLLTLGPGERCNLHLPTPTGESQLLIRASEMQLGEHSVRILTLNDIRSEMDSKELDSWIRLTRVLTHEIMNSIAPISSLSETFMKRDDVINSSLYEGIRAIHETSTGLISFVDSYRKFSSLQKPAPEPFYLTEMTGQVEGLNLIPPHIRFTKLIEPSDLMLYADPNMIRQVLINLIKNAVQAIGNDKGRIHLHACSSADEHVFVYVSNSGPIIPEKDADEIFVPFFTTKKEGSGIGLSLSRQIMKLSGGSISLLKAGTNGWNTTFVLEFE